MSPGQRPQNLQVESYFADILMLLFLFYRQGKQIFTNLKMISDKIKLQTLIYLLPKDSFAVMLQSRQHRWVNLYFP